LHTSKGDGYTTKGEGPSRFAYNERGDNEIAFQGEECRRTHRRATADRNTCTLQSAGFMPLRLQHSALFSKYLAKLARI
jgi:hypothetical protein